METSDFSQSRLIAWSEAHAFAMTLILGGIGFFGLAIGVLGMVALLSFMVLIGLCRRQWTPRGDFGAANVLTLLRLMGIAILLVAPAPDKFIFSTLALLLLVMDAADGYIARRLGTASEFGAFFDKEVDAFFMLALCVSLYAEHRFQAWILVPGALRYAFVLLLRMVKPRHASERRSALGRWIYALTMMALIIAFLPFPRLAFVLVATMTVALVYSFLLSLWHCYGPFAYPLR